MEKAVIAQLINLTGKNFWLLKQKVEDWQIFPIKNL